MEYTSTRTGNCVFLCHARRPSPKRQPTKAPRSPLAKLRDRFEQTTSTRTALPRKGHSTNAESTPRRTLLAQPIAARPRKREFRTTQRFFTAVNPMTYRPKNSVRRAIWQPTCARKTQAEYHKSSNNRFIYCNLQVNIIPIIRHKLT